MLPSLLLLLLLLLYSCCACLLFTYIHTETDIQTCTCMHIHARVKLLALPLQGRLRLNPRLLHPFSNHCALWSACAQWSVAPTHPGCHLASCPMIIMKFADMTFFSILTIEGSAHTLTHTYRRTHSLITNEMRNFSKVLKKIIIHLHRVYAFWPRVCTLRDFFDTIMRIHK